MKLKYFIVPVALLALLVNPTLGWADAQESQLEVKVQTTCPVMGGEINKALYADHDGKRVYFCCEGCRKPFEVDPNKYIKKLETQGVVLDKTPVEQSACPVSGKTINEEIYTDHNGERIYFCCNGCKAAFEEEPEKYLKKS